MSYGLKIWDNSGFLLTGPNIQIPRLVYSKLLQSDGSVDLPIISGHTTVHYAWSFACSVIQVTRSGTTIFWELQNPSCYSWTDWINLFVTPVYPSLQVYIVD